jgi:hypothetical protein
MSMNYCYHDFEVWKIDDHSWACELPKGHPGPHQLSGVVVNDDYNPKKKFKLEWEDLDD